MYLAPAACGSKAELPIIDNQYFLQIKQRVSEGWLVFATHFEYLSYILESWLWMHFKLMKNKNSQSS